MDKSSKDFHNRLVQELEHVNNTLNKVLKLLHGLQKQGQEADFRDENAGQRSNISPGETPLNLNASSKPVNQKKPGLPWHRPFEWWKSRVEIAAFIFGIGYAVVTYLQWRDLRHNFMTDERAWIKAEISLPEKLDPNAPVVVTARNVGKSPALELFGGIIVQVVDATQSPAFPSGANIRQIEGRMLFPNDATSVESGRTPNNSDGSLRPLTEPEISSLTAGKAYLATFGFFTYKDQFGDHWTRFCTSRGYQIGWRDYHTLGCARYNTQGEGTPRWSAPE